MTAKLKTRAQRLHRVAHVGDVLARVAEAALVERQTDLQAKQDRLNTIKAYQAEYLDLTGQRLQTMTSAATLMLYRNFTVWLDQIEVNQEQELSQAQFMVEAASEEVAQRRGFARALEQVADRATAVCAVREEKMAQQQLEELAGSRQSSGLASDLLSTDQQQ